MKLMVLGVSWKILLAMIRTIFKIDAMVEDIRSETMVLLDEWRGNIHEKAGATEKTFRGWSLGTLTN